MKTINIINNYINITDNKKEKSSLKIYYNKNVKPNIKDGNNYEISFLNSIVEIYKAMGIEPKIIYEYMFNLHNYINELNNNKKNRNFTAIYESLLDKDKKINLIDYINMIKGNFITDIPLMINTTDINNVTNSDNSSHIANNSNVNNVNSALDIFNSYNKTNLTDIEKSNRHARISRLFYTVKETNITNVTNSDNSSYIANNSNVNNVTGIPLIINTTDITNITNITNVTNSDNSSYIANNSNVNNVTSIPLMINTTDITNIPNITNVTNSDNSSYIANNSNVNNVTGIPLMINTTDITNITNITNVTNSDNSSYIANNSNVNNVTSIPLMINTTDITNITNVTDINKMPDIINITYNYYQNLIKTEKKYEKYQNFISTNNNSDSNSNKNTLHLVLQGNALKEFLKQANRTLLITDKNLKIISNSMYYLNNYSLDKVFKSLNITSADSLEQFFKNKRIKNKVFLPILALNLIKSKNGSVKNVNFNEIYFTPSGLSDKSNITTEFIYKVNKIIDRNVVCKFDDVKNYIQNKFGDNKEKKFILFNLFGKNQNNIVYNKQFSKKCLKDQIIKEKDNLSYLYKSLNKFVNKISFIIDLLEELKVEDPVDKVLNNLKLNIDHYKDIYYDYQNCIKCKYDPLEYYNINQQVFNNYMNAEQKMKNSLSRPFIGNYNVEGKDFRIAGNENVSKSIIQYLSKTPFSQNQIAHLIYNFIYLNLDYDFYEEAYKIIEVLGEKKLKKLLMNRKQFYENEIERNVFVQGVISPDATISAISKIYFYKNGTNPLKTPISPLNETSFLKNLIEYSEGSVPSGLLKIDSPNVQFELKKIFEENRKNNNNLKPYVIDYSKDDNVSAGIIASSFFGGCLSIGILGGFAYFIFKRFFNTESSNSPVSNDVSYTKDPTTTDFEDTSLQ